jgi:DNA gyrase subunit B
LQTIKRLRKSLQRLTVRYPASVLDALISVEGFKLDQNHDRAYVEQWAEQVRSAVAEIQPSLRPELSLETFEKELADGQKIETYPRITIYVHNLPHSYLLDAGLLGSGEYARLLKNSKSWFTLLKMAHTYKKVIARLQSLTSIRYGSIFSDSVVA